MMKIELNDTLQINGSSHLPKYEQVIVGITEAITNKVLTRGDTLPSINYVSKNYSIARQTVVKAYKELQKRGIIESRPAKGYFVATESIKHTVKVFLLIDSFDPYMQVLFNSFKKCLADQAMIDVYFHHCNFEVFETLVLDNIGKYGVYLIKSFKDKRVSEVIKHIEPDKVLVIDRGEYLKDPYSYLVQDFGVAVYDCLQSGLSLLKKYQEMVLVFPQPSIHPNEIMDGFSGFCKDHNLNFSIISTLEGHRIQAHRTYLVIEDEDMVNIVKSAKENNLRIGRDIGLISYNDTPMKSIITDGITVISTDWKYLGEEAATYVLKREKIQMNVPTRLIIRSSL